MEAQIVQLGKELLIQELSEYLISNYAVEPRQQKGHVTTIEMDTETSGKEQDTS